MQQYQKNTNSRDEVQGTSGDSRRNRNHSRPPRTDGQKSGKKPEMQRTKIVKKWANLQVGDTVTRQDGTEFELAPGFNPDSEYINLLPKNGQGRCRILGAVVQTFKMPEFEVLVPKEKQKDKPDAQPQTVIEAFVQAKTEVLAEHGEMK